MSFLSTILLALTLSVDPVSGAVSVHAEGEPLGEVLSALRREGHANVMSDAALDDRRVWLDGRYPSVAEALAAIGRVANLEVEASGGVFLVRLPKAAAPVPASPPRLEYRNGLWRAPDALAYPVKVLRDRPEDATARAEVDGFEGRPGWSLVVAPTVKAIVLREMLETRAALAAILERAGVGIDVKSNLDDRDIRVYVHAVRKRYAAEVRYSRSPPAAPSPGSSGPVSVAHWVFSLDVETLACERLTVFRTEIPSVPPSPGR